MNDPGGIIRNMLTLNRRGMSPLLLLFEVVAVLIIVFTLVSVAARVGSAETVRKKTIADDMQMMVNLLVALPGEALVRYPQDTADFIIFLDQQSSSVAVYLPEDAKNEQLWETRQLHLPTNYYASGVAEQQAQVCLSKTGKQVLLGCPS